ncbi:MAG: 16S rRNA processing protein RimM [Ruminococcaceae bacterium]|nr:16S rRNA processing protein RimM [Oscillospiraceae bacterium]
MIKKFLEAGKIVGTHGVRGEMRVECWCDSPQFLSQFKTLYFNEGAEKIKVKSRTHKNMVLMKVPGVETIEQADLYRGRVLYIKRSDIKLEEGVNFVQDMIGLEVVDTTSCEAYGKIKDVLRTGSNDVYEMTGKDNKLYYIPAIPDIIDSVDIDGGVIKITPMKGLFSDED